MRFLAAKNINWEEEANGPRIVAMMTANFRGNAAAWCMLNRDKVHDIQELMHNLTKEFVPRDNQRRLRDKLYNLRQSRCQSLEDYIGKYRVLLMQIRDISELDKITYFTRGLLPQLGREVEYRHCDDISECFSVVLEYDRTYFGGSFRQQSDNRQRFSPRPSPQSRFRPHSQPFPRFERPTRTFPSYDGPEPMEIDNAQVRRSHQVPNRPHKRCSYCKKSGHLINERFKKQNNDARRENQQRSSHRPPRRTNVNYFEYDENKEEHEYEANNFYVQPRSQEDPTPETSEEEIIQQEVKEHGENELVRMPAKCNGKDIVVMFDSDATDNTIKPGTINTLTEELRIKVNRFDGTSTTTQSTRKGEVVVEVCGRKFKIPVMEWKMDDTQDLILGKPFYHWYDPQINYRTHEVFFKPEVDATLAVQVSSAEFKQKLKKQEYEEVYRVKICQVATEITKTPPDVQKLINKYQDAFPEALPDGLPPRRRVEFELCMRPDATPSNRPPFRLSKTEQDALDVFVEEKLKKGGIELSDSPWVSNVFGIPKKDPSSGKQTSRSEWIRSGNSTLPIRWVIDYRYVNSQTVVPKIPLPRIEELFDKMQGASVFSVLDLAQGYHQMRVSPESRKYTAFRTHSETYQWCVAPMGLAGIPGVWSRLMRILFGKYPFIVVYLDDICVFSTAMEEHIKHLGILFEKDTKWEWNEPQRMAFDALKDALQRAPVLKLPDFDREFIVTTDASGHCVGGVLSQKYGSADHPIAFYSKKLGTHELNWPTHEKELFAIKMGLEKWRHYLYGKPFILFTDNSACPWLLHHPKVSAKLARYLTFIAQFNFQIHHVSGSLNAVADALSRQSQDVGSIQFHRCTADCRPHALKYRSTFRATTMPKEFAGGESVPQIHSAMAASYSSVSLAPAERNAFISAYKKDKKFRDAWENQDTSDKFVKMDELLYLRTHNNTLRLCVPEDYQLRTKIIALSMIQPSQRIQVSVEHASEMCNGTIGRKNGKLIPIAVPEECWEVVSMDFITGLPESNGFDAIFTVVDKLSKRAKYVAVKTTDDAEKIAHVFFDNVVRHHGMPAVIISDRDPKFTSHFWRSLAKIMGIKLNMTTSHRAQADGQTERQNLILEDALRCATSYHGRDWSEKLATTEYAHATLTSASTGLSPFEIDTGRKEHHPVGLPAASNISKRKETTDLAEIAKTFHDEREKIIDKAKKQLKQAQESQKR
ncbi:Retroelement pol polyprotein, partial [Globisporangium splendens]